MPNILSNTPLHIHDFHPASIKKTFFAYPGKPGKLLRPVANFSFAINWYFGKNQTFGYHLVNISIHFLTSIALYLSCLLLLQSPASEECLPRKLGQSAALLAAVLWTMAPINTQAVTYIVQRMALLAGLFSTWGIYFFLLFSLNNQIKKRLIYGICCLLCCFLALGSKENAILLPLSFILIQLIFFHTNPISLTNIKKKITLLSIVFILFAIVLWKYGYGLINYEHRTFTLQDRLLTEPRILLYYFSQIFFPQVSNLSIEHDIIISHSIWSPWTTLPSIFLIICAVILAILRRKQNPLLCFAVLFFFLNHLVESTFIPLELLFEHRNYLPSLFLFFPIAVFFTIFLNSSKPGIHLGKISLFIAGTLFIFISGNTTMERNRIWASELSLWQDACNKAPNSSRSKLNLATVYIYQNRHHEALLLLDQVEETGGSSRNKMYPLSLALRSDIAFREKQFDTSLTYLKEALALRYDFTDAAYKYIDQLIKLGHYEKALEFTEKYYQYTKEEKLLFIKAILLLNLGQPKASLTIFNQIDPSFPDMSLITVGKGKAMSMQGDYRQANTLLESAHAKKVPESNYIRINNYLAWGHRQEALELLTQMLNSVPLMHLLEQLSTPSTGSFHIPYDYINIKKLLFKIIDQNTFQSVNKIQP